MRLNPPLPARQPNEGQQSQGFPDTETPSRGAARIDEVLERLNVWVVAKGGGLLSWVLGIAGFLVARNAAVRLWFPRFFGGS